MLCDFLWIHEVFHGDGKTSLLPIKLKDLQLNVMILKFKLQRILEGFLIHGTI